MESGASRTGQETIVASQGPPVTASDTQESAGSASKGQACRTSVPSVDFQHFAGLGWLKGRDVLVGTGTFRL